ncbi:MAG: AzlD domain-containing protein [Micrococcales bacterium]|nr:AzlD domain-containing protein [Micrococcales bacterium]
MSLWAAILVAAAIAYALKLVGYLVPGHLLEGARTKRLTAALPIALLAALIATQTFVTDGAVVLDARAAAVAVAAVALLLRAPFILVVVLGAATAAGLRLLGWAS